MDLRHQFAERFGYLNAAKNKISTTNFRLMELETYESDCLAFALEEQPFYETKPSFYDLQMASQLLNGQMNNGQNGHYNQMNNLSMPLLNNGIISSGKHKKKKSVKFNNNLTIKTYVPVSIIYIIKTIIIIIIAISH